MNFTQFNKSLTRIYWGVSSSSQNKEIFHNHMREFLNKTLQLSINTNLSKFFFDLFLNSKTIGEAHVSFALVAMILSRITANRDDLSDLFSIYIATCSQESFDFYIKKALQNVLTGKNREFLKKALQKFAKKAESALKNYNESKREDFFEREMFKNSHKSTNIFISYNFEFENFDTRTVINPSKKNLFELNETHNTITELNSDFLKSPSVKKHKIAVDFMIEKNYTPYAQILQNNYSIVFNDKLIYSQKLNEIISLYNKERQDIIEETERRLTTGEITENSLKKKKNLMKLKAYLMKPFNLSLAVPETTSFDERFDRYSIHTNEELKKFAELRENWANNVVEDLTLRKLKQKKIEGRKGYYFIRRGGMIRLAKINKSGEIVPLPEQLPPHIVKRMGVKPIYTVRKKLFRKKNKKSQNKKRKIQFNQRTKQKVFGRTANLAAFSTLKEPNEKEFEEPEIDEDYEFTEKHIKNESGFKVYLQKLKQIEEERKKQEENSEKEISSIKKNLFKEDSLFTTPFNKEKPLFTSMKSKGTAEKQENLETFEKNKKNQQKDAQSMIFRKTNLQKEEKKTPETSVYSHLWEEKLQLYGENLKDFRKIQGVILSYLEENQEKKDELLKALVSLPKEGAFIVEFLLSEKVKKLEKSEKLSLEFVSQMGLISNDYNHYLKGTSFDYALPSEVYLKLLEMQSNNVQYNRKVFKRIMAHMIRYLKAIPLQIIEAYLKVAKEQQMGLTTVEFLQLIIKNNIVIDQASAKILLNFIGRFKIISEDIEELYKNLLKTYEWPHNFEFLEGYLNMLIEQKKSEIYMKLFENIKEFLAIRKTVNNSEENKETNKTKDNVIENNENEEKEQRKIDEANLNLQENSKENNEEKQQENEVHSFYIDFVGCLNKYQELKFSKLVFYDFLNQKFTLVQRDYINGLIAFADSGEEFLVLFNRYKESPFFIMNEELFRILVGAVNTNPIELMSIFDEILENYVYTKKYDFTLYSLNSFIFTFGRTKKFFEFTNFLRFIKINKLEIDRNTKLACYRVLGKVSDDMSKPYIKGLIDSIFEFYLFFFNYFFKF